jgi:hypothetical protein
VDLAIRIGRLRDSTLIARRLFDARTVVCASPKYLDEHGVPYAPADLQSRDCLVYGNLADPRRWVYQDKSGASHHVDVKVAMSATSGEFLCQAAMQGLGIVVQPTFIAGEKICSGELVPILTEYEWPVSPAYAVYPPTRHLSYRVRAFIDFLAERFAGIGIQGMDRVILGRSRDKHSAGDNRCREASVQLGFPSRRQFGTDGGRCDTAARRVVSVGRPVVRRYVARLRRCNQTVCGALFKPNDAWDILRRIGIRGQGFEAVEFRFNAACTGLVWGVEQAVAGHLAVLTRAAYEVD